MGLFAASRPGRASTVPSARSHAGHRSSLGAGVLALSLALPPGLTGCFGYKNVERDRDTHPVVMTGVSGTILYPGENPSTLPTLPPGATTPGNATSQQSQQSGSPGSSARSSQSSSGSGMPSPGGAPVFIGGGESDISQRRREHVEPAWYNPFWFPFAVMLAPFRLGAKAVDYVKEKTAGEPEANAAASTPEPSAATREALQRDYEAARLRELERQLARRGSRNPSPAGHATASSSATPSIAEELAALRARRRSVPEPAPAEERGEPEARPRAAAPAAADRVEDRDGDGRPDRWVYRSEGVVVRERLDDDGDGHAERSLFYANGHLERVEEDLDGDERVDAWTYYRDGVPARRRLDRDGDGIVDAWTFFEGQHVARHEEDTDGDGFRDRIDHYAEGELARREEDRNGDGVPDRISEYENGALRRVDEDPDGDGRFDVRSHYRNGRLARRELLTELAAQQAIDASAPEPGEPLSP